MTNDNLFAEIDEDFERQKLEALWKKYGPLIILIAVGIVVATASSTAYRSWKAERDQKVTAQFIQTTKPGMASADSIAALQKFTGQYPSSAQADIALLQAGTMAAEQGDKAKATQLFDSVASNTKADLAFRQLGDLLSVQTQLDSGDPATLTARLQPLTEEKAVWRYSALEAQAYLDLRAGDQAKAKQILTILSQDARTPQSLAARATDILRSMP